MASSTKKGKSKYDVDFDDYDGERGGGGYDGDVPKKGLYEGRLVSLKEHTSSSGNEGLEWIYEITEEPYAGWRGWVYTNMSTAKWKTQQCTAAISGGTDKPVRLMPADENGDGTESSTVAKAKPVMLRIVQETYEDEKKGRIRSVLPAEEGSGKGGSKKKRKNDDEDEDLFPDD